MWLKWLKYAIFRIWHGLCNTSGIRRKGRPEANRGLEHHDRHPFVRSQRDRRFDRARAFTGPGQDCRLDRDCVDRRTRPGAHGVSILRFEDTPVSGITSATRRGWRRDKANAKIMGV